MGEKTESSCPLCGGSIELGFIQDHGHNVRYAAEWIQGPPIPAFWAGVKTGVATHRQLEAFRCANCGYVMLFARQAV
jgi:predicted RNA-binding Zn-ribbon protein involved in translation (DUF1610 family)